MKYRIDVTIGSTDQTLGGYDTDPEADKSTTVSTDVEGLDAALAIARDQWTKVSKAGLPIHSVCVINPVMVIVATIDAANPNG